MSYQIGSYCFQTKEAATDYQLSQVLPVITADGKLVHPVKQGQDWYFNGQKIQPNFPQCSIEQDLAQGAQIAGAIIALMAAAWCFRLLSRFIYTSLTEKDTPND